MFGYPYMATASLSACLRLSGVTRLLRTAALLCIGTPSKSDRRGTSNRLTIVGVMSAVV